MNCSWQTLREAVLRELDATLGAVDERQVDTLRRAIGDAPRVFVAGKGRSGLAARASAMRQLHLGLTAFVVDEVTTPGLQANDLLLIASGSGRTPTLVQYAERAKKIGARVALVTIQAGSPIAQAADVAV